MKERLMETKWLIVIEAAQYLKMGRSTVYKLAQEGKLPTHKVGRQWRFDAKEPDKWLKSGKLASLEERR
ncbi:helix-turn-helix domain-containing protein [Olavius algarvensis spirochete endosymbiont]|uniref:helix-turn-helix domain-containing protein n=1 Tax=Olavius algarvensis spirochete endosymbiont TaxID=260710 RepID=UPI001E4BD195|nr:helix-turn-helix domain-containing protein [Olavius algarvensis spirochete endosymbiont]